MTETIVRPDPVARSAEPVSPERLHDSVLRWGETSPEAEALRWRDQVVTYGVLAARTRRTAATLTRHGIAGTRVALALHRTPEAVITQLAVWAAGGTVVPLDPAHPGARLRNILNIARPALLVTDDETTLEQPGVAEFDPLMAPLPESEGAFDDAGESALCLFTSGSTGTPKGVLMGQTSLARLAAATRERPGLSQDDVMLGHHTFAFDMSIADVYLPLTAGACVVLADDAARQDPHALIGLIDEHGVNLVEATPTMWQMLLAAGLRCSNGGMRGMSGGEALPRAVADELADRGVHMWNMYGPTENTTFTSAGVVRRSVPLDLGRPMTGVRWYLLDENLHLVPPGARGEIAIGGRLLSWGYLGDHARTAAKFVPDAYSSEPGARMYLTGDDAVLDDDGMLRFAGRRDGQVKVRGFRVELSEVEAALLAHPAVERAAVILGVDSDLVGYVVLRQGVDLSDLRTWMRRRMLEAMVPRRLFVVDELPTTPNGKLDRERLRAAGASEQEPQPAAVSGADDLVNRISAIWADHLGIPTVDPDEDFFDLGGHSLLGMRIVVRMREELGVPVSVTKLFESGSARALARAITASGAETTSSSTVATRPTSAMARLVGAKADRIGLVRRIDLPAERDSTWEADLVAAVEATLLSVRLEISREGSGVLRLSDEIGVDVSEEDCSGLTEQEWLERVETVRSLLRDDVRQDDGTTVRAISLRTGSATTLMLGADGVLVGDWLLDLVCARLTRAESGSATVGEPSEIAAGIEEQRRGTEVRRTPLRPCAVQPHVLPGPTAPDVDTLAQLVAATFDGSPPAVIRHGKPLFGVRNDLLDGESDARIAVTEFPRCDAVRLSVSVEHPVTVLAESSAEGIVATGVAVHPDSGLAPTAVTAALTDTSGSEVWS